MSFRLSQDVELSEESLKSLAGALSPYLKDQAPVEEDTPPPPVVPPSYSRVHVIEDAQQLNYRLSVQEPGTTIRIVKPIKTRRPIDITASNYEIIVDPGAQLLFSGFIPFDGTWEREGQMWRAEYKGFPGLKTHAATNEGPWDGHRDRMRPEQMHQAGKMLRQVYNKGAVEPGCFFVEGPSESPNAIYLITKDEGEPENMYISAFPRMCYTSKGAKNVRMVGVDFEGGANTGKVGMVERGDYWDFIGCSARFAAAAGFKISGKGGETINTIAEDNGQLGYLVMGHNDGFLNRLHSYRNNRKGFNAAQEAGGCKIINCDRLTFGVEGSDEDYAIWSEDDNGVSFWEDIDNNGHKVYNINSYRAMAAGAMLEHGFRNGIVKNTRIKDVREYVVPVNGWKRRDGLVMQSHIWNNLVEGLLVDGADKAVVYKWQERRGPSGGNVFKDFTYLNIAVMNFYRERMTEAKIRESIANGEFPENYGEWFSADTYENVGFAA